MLRMKSVTSQVAHISRTYLGICSIKQLGVPLVFYSLQDWMLVCNKVAPSISSPRVNRDDVIKHQDSESRDHSQISLVLTFHPLSERIKRILVSNFSILSDDPQTKEIFPQPPLIAYRHDRNVRVTLVHTADRNQPGPHVGTSPCTHNRCRTCDYISRDSTLQGPQCSINIKNAFTCQSSGLVYAISCRRCSAVYIGETGRALRERFGEHLRSIEKNLPGFPVAEHFNANGHTLQDRTSPRGHALRRK